MAATVLGHRPGLDGIRGVAVALVLGLHWWPTVFPGGYLGVDLFFVLSGFLITSLLLEESQRTGSVHLGRFYERRARRLFPALAVLLAVCWSVPQAWTVAAYVANWARVGGHLVGGPLEHTWSLAIEEQFYLLWPVAFLGLRRLRWAPWFLAGLVIAVMLHRVGVADPDRAINGFDTRVDGLLVGCLAAWVRPLVVRWRGWVPLSIVSFGLLGWWLVGGFVAHRFGYTIVALACVPLLYAGSQATGGPLVSKPLTTLGVLSYSLYLWHYPVTWWLRGGDIYNTNDSTTVAAIMLTACAAVASYRLVELPLRRRPQVLRVPLERVARTSDEQPVPGGVLAGS